MNTGTLISKLEKLDKKVQNLITLHQEEKEQGEKNKTENVALKRRISELEEALKETKHSQIVNTLISHLQENNPNHKEIKHKINEFIREIDKCIALLND